MSDYYWCDFVGNVGVFFILFCYLLWQMNKMTSDSLFYFVLCGLGASFILDSLVYEFNLSALVVELAWVLISLFGVYKFYSHRSEIAGASDISGGRSL